MIRHLSAFKLFSMALNSYRKIIAQKKNQLFKEMSGNYLE